MTDTADVTALRLRPARLQHPGAGRPRSRWRRPRRFGRRWLLLEVAAAWGPSAFRDSPLLDPALGARIERRAAADGFRLVAIRRPGRGRHADGTRWRWARVDSAPGAEGIVWGEAGRLRGII